MILLALNCISSVFESEKYVKTSLYEMGWDLRDCLRVLLLMTLISDDLFLINYDMPLIAANTTVFLIYLRK